MTLDFTALREDFPILKRQVYGKPLIYLDSAATSQMPSAVIERWAEYYSTFNANIHRGVHALSEEATAAYETVRKQTAAFIGADSALEITFTRNATEAINLVAHAWGRKFLKAGDEVIVSSMEHHANLVPWQMLAEAIGVKLRFIRMTSEGRLDPEHYRSLFTERTRLVAVTHMSNVLGTINPVKAMAAEAHARGALILVDGAQSVPHMPVDVRDLDCDFLVFSAHKMLGPSGVGVLYARRALLDAMDPFLGGGEMIAEVTLERSTWNDVPWKFEAGTPNISGVVAFGAALSYLEKVGMAAIADHERVLTRHLLGLLSQIEGLRIFGPVEAGDRNSTVSFELAEVHPHDLGTFLDAEGIAVRVGHHCAQPVMQFFKVPAMARASCYLYTTLEELDRFADAVKRARTFFGV